MAELNGLSNERLQVIQLLNGESLANEDTANLMPEPQVRLRSVLHRLFAVLQRSALRPPERAPPS